MSNENVMTIDPSSISQNDLYHYLIAAVAPRPICFASTMDKAGNVNLSPFSFFNVFSTKPPIMIFSPARSGRDNSTKHTYQNILEVKETVINIVNYPIVEQMSLASTAYDKGVDEFIKAGLTPVESEKVKPPRVAESPVAFECTVDQVIELGDGPGAGNLIIARVVLIHIQPKYLNEAGKLDTQKLDLVARMGEHWYCRANEESLFSIPKPIQHKGIGIDQLPESIRSSDLLTGNELGRLGNIQSLPSKEEILAVKSNPEVEVVINNNTIQGKELRVVIQLLAKSFLKKEKTLDAIKLLMLPDYL